MDDRHIDIHIDILDVLWKLCPIRVVETLLLSSLRGNFLLQLLLLIVYSTPMAAR